jgi:hypothetical protein
MKATVKRVKVAWIRDASVPMGIPAKGQLSCLCGNAPITDYNKAQGDVHCPCGAVYTWDGWVVKESPPFPKALERGLHEQNYHNLNYTPNRDEPTT